MRNILVGLDKTDGLVRPEVKIADFGETSEMLRLPNLRNYQEYQFTQKSMLDDETFAAGQMADCHRFASILAEMVRKVRDAANGGSEFEVPCRILHAIRLCQNPTLMDTPHEYLTRFLRSVYHRAARGDLGRKVLVDVDSIIPGEPMTSSSVQR